MTMPERQDALAERAAAVQRLQALPAAMRERRQWLLWRYEEVEGREGLQKVPYYASGAKRFGDLGDEKDRGRLVPFDEAVRRFGAALQFTGVGFAFLKGDGLIGIDLDWKDTGEPSAQHQQIIEACASYTETTPSGKGVHVIAAGECDSFKSDAVGVEVYSGGRYFTCTGDRWASQPAEVRPLPAMALGFMQALVQAAKDRAAAERARQRPAAAAGPVRDPGGDDFRRVNDMALQALAAWVPAALPGARAYHAGYRVTSKELGRDLQEDLQLLPEGVYDFGEERGMSPIDVVMQWVPGMGTPKAALEWLAQRVGVQLTRRPPLRVVRRDEPPPDADFDPGEPPPRDPDEPPPPPLEGEGPPAPPTTKGGGGGGRPKRTPRGLGYLLEHFALVYGSDDVWDGTQRMLMKVKNLRLLHGNDTVKFWLGSAERRVVYPENIRFEPGVELPPGCVNLFDGLPTQPVECTEAEVAPMLDLLRHLTSLSAPTQAGVDEVFHQVLCWCALMVQRPGAKMRFALVFHGPQGTGKNLFWDGFRKILGRYGKMVGQKELEDRFNGYMSGKLLLIGNEVVTRQELFHNKNMLKWVITEDEIPIRGMHQETRWESNHANVVFLSNELMPVALEQDDRRHLVVYTPAAEDPALYLRVAEFLREQGHAKFMHFLQHYDIGGFNEFTKPLMTEAKAALIDLGLKPAERFANEWLQGFLEVPVRVCSASQLYRVFRRWADHNGERYAPTQAVFTRQVDRHVYERREMDPATGKRKAPALAYKQINLDPGPSEQRKTVRCWVPAGCQPPNGVSEGQWAHESVQAFERYVAVARGDDD